MKKVLIITYYWPPSGGPGVQRWLKFTKYHPDYGIEPIVLTVDPTLASYPQKDESLVSEVSDTCKIFYTRTFELYNLYKFLLRKKEIPFGGFANEKEPGLLQKTIRFFRSHLLIPDPRKGWNKFAYQKAVELINRYNIDTVITTSPPHSTQLIGLRLKDKLTIKWIVDLRDPWTDIYYYKSLYHSWLSSKIDKHLEKKVLANADKIITVSNDLKEIFTEKLAVTRNDNIFVIPNGFDTSDFDYSIQPGRDEFLITYTGTLTEDYRIESFLRVLKKFSLSKPRLKVRLIGKIHENIITKITNYQLEKYIEVMGYVSHNLSIQSLLESHALLLIIPDVEKNKGILTGKLFEYIGAGRPIIGLGPATGDAAKIIDESKTGKMFDYSNKDETFEYLCTLYNNFLKGDVIMGLSPLNLQYSRKELTKVLVDHCF